MANEGRQQSDKDGTARLTKVTQEAGNAALHGQKADEKSVIILYRTAFTDFL